MIVTLKRQAMGCIEHFQRQTLAGCLVKHPWQVVMDNRLLKKLFYIFEAAVLQTNFGPITRKTQKSCVIAFTSHHRVRKLFSDLTDEILARQSFLKQKVKGD